MISALLHLTIATQLAAGTLPEYPPLIILGKDEPQESLSKLFDVELNEEFILKETGLKVHELRIEGRTVYVSERVAPLDGYVETTKFLTALRRGDRQFKLNSEQGQQLSNLFKLIAPRQSFEAKPEDECYATFASVSVDDPSGTMPPVKSLSYGFVPPRDAPRRTKWTNQEELRKSYKDNISQALIFPLIFTQSSFITVPLTKDRINDELAASNIKLCGSALEKIGSEIVKLQAQCGALYNEIRIQYANQYANGIPLDGKPVKLSKLDPKVADKVRQQIEAMYMFESDEELKRIQAFLDTDPELTFEVRIGAFEAYSNVNPDGTTAVRSGAGFVFGHPGGEKPRKNPPPN